MSNTELECPNCGNTWEPRVASPKYCPRCKRPISSQTNTKSILKELLNDLAESRNGYHFDQPWRFTEKSLLAVLPIIRDPHPERDYVTLEKAQKNGTINIEDTGNIDRTRIENNGEKPVYIRMGQIFEGGTQPRTAVHSIVIMPQQKSEIEVKCVSASTPINKGAKFRAGGIAPRITEEKLMDGLTGRRGNLQANVWQSVTSYARAVSPSSQKEAYHAFPQYRAGGRGRTTRLGSTRTTPRSDDLAKTTKEFKEQISEIINKVPTLESQVGMALLDIEGCRGLELFNVPKSWQELREDIIAKNGEEIKKPKESVFKYIPEKAKGLIQDTLRQDYKIKKIWEEDNARTYSLVNTEMSGEITELNGKIIHLVINRG